MGSFCARTQRIWPVAVALALASSVGGACKKDADKGEGESSNAPQADTVVDTPPTPSGETSAPVEEVQGPVGSIQGTVTLEGDIPEMPVLPKGSDPKCDQTEMRAETIKVGANAGLANAVVRLAPGAIVNYKPSKTLLSKPVVIDQIQCMYRPRVQGGVRGQALEVRNSDPTTHNVHTKALAFGNRQDGETLSNKAQPPGVLMTLELGDAPVTKLKCDVHSWMQGYVVVSDHPYFATTDDSGSFEIANVPVGSYPVEVWHEFYGVKTADVEVKEGGATELKLNYHAQADSPLKD